MKTRSKHRSLMVNGVTALDRIMALLEGAPAGLPDTGIAVTINRDLSGTRRVLAALRARHLVRQADDGRWQLTEHAWQLVKERGSL